MYSKTIWLIISTIIMKYEADVVYKIKNVIFILGEYLLMAYHVR
jgi:hypothetical protein